MSNFEDKEQKNINTIVGLYEKIQNIKNQQIFIKSFENDISDILLNLFPHLKLEKNKIEDLKYKITNAASKSDVIEFLETTVYLETYNNKSKSSIENEHFESLFGEIDSLKHKFDNIISHLKNLESDIIKIEKKIINSKLTKFSNYE